MSNLTRGTTPTITINTDADLSGYDVVYLTIEDKDGTEVTVDQTQMEITSSSVAATLTQEQTIQLAKGRLKLQVRARSGTSAVASDIMFAQLDGILKDGVI